MHERAYQVQPSVEYGRTIVTNMAKNTGRSVAEWVALLRDDGVSGDTQRRTRLKAQHALGATTAMCPWPKLSRNGPPR